MFETGNEGKPAIMSNLQIAALAYGAITLLYLLPTYIEGERAGGQWSAHRWSGLFFCLLWPLLTLVFIYRATSGASKTKFVFANPAPTARATGTNRRRD